MHCSKIRKKKTEQALKIIEQVNEELVLKDEALQEQIVQYQEITKDLLAINDSLGTRRCLINRTVGGYTFKK